MIRNSLFAAVGLLLLVVIVLASFGLPLSESLQRIMQGAFGSEAGFGRTLVRMTPLLLTSLGVLVAWRAGMFNIGGEGQYIVGGVMGAAIAKIAQPVSGPMLSLLILCASVLGGALYAWIAAWMQERRSIPAVISTILLNFVAVQFLEWSVRGPLQERSLQLPQSDAIPDSAMLHRFNPQSDLHIGVFISLIVAACITLWLYRTRSGFETRLVGESFGAARASRIPAAARQIQAMALSGALCGLAGGVELTGMSGRLDAGFSQQWGFLGIPVALLGGLHPVGAIFSSFFFGALFAGSQNLARMTPGGDRIIFVIQGVAVLAFLATNRLAEQRAMKMQPETE